MLNLQLAEAFVDVAADVRKFDQGMAYVRAVLARMPAVHVIHVGVNATGAAASLNQLIQQLRAAQALTRFHFTATRGPGFGGFGGGGGGGGGVLSGFGQGLGLPFSTSPQMMAGQLAGSGVRSAIGTAAGLQTQMAELRRVSGMSAAGADAFKKQIMDLGQKRPGVSIEDLLEIAQVGGRAGVAEKGGPAALIEFTDQLAQVKNAIGDMPTETLANSMAKVLNVFELGTDRVAGFGSALTAMDNVSVASAKDILDITTRLSGTAQAIGLTLPQVLALSSVLKDVGLSNEVAGTAFSQIFRKMATDSAKFAGEIGVDARTFADAYRRDPMEALGMVIAKFKELDDTIAGQEFLKGLGFEGARVTGALQQLASKYDDVAGRAKVASAETGNLNALIAANELKSGTAEGGMLKLKNAATALGDALGGPLLGPLADATNALANLTKAASEGRLGGVPAALKMAAGIAPDFRGMGNARGLMPLFGGVKPIPAIGPDQRPKANQPALPAIKPAAGEIPAGLAGIPIEKALDFARAIGDRELARRLIGADAKRLPAGLNPDDVAAHKFNEDRLKSLAQMAAMAAAARPKLDLRDLVKSIPEGNRGFSAGLSGADVGQRIQEDILNMANKTSEEHLREAKKQTEKLDEINKALRERPTEPGILA